MTGAVLDKAAGVDISFTDNKNRGGARYRAALGFLMGVERTRQMMKIGFIGTGNMGGALASAAARSGEVEVLLANRTKAKAETLAERIGAVVSSNEIIAREADHIFLGVKPQMIVDVLKGIARRSRSARARRYSSAWSRDWTSRAFRSLRAGTIPSSASCRTCPPPWARV